jgi:ABC-type Na+ efflux pump permease subunit
VVKPMKLSKNELKGTNSVFTFTLQQYAKSKANIITAIIMVIMALVSIPVMTLMSGGDVKESANISTVYINNSAVYTLAVDELKEDSFWKHTEFKNADFTVDEYKAHIADNEAFINIYFNEQISSYCVDVYTSENSVLEDNDLSALSEAASKLLSEVRYASLNATAEQMNIVMSKYNVETESIEGYLSEDGPGFETKFAVQYAYAIIVLLLCMITTAYIIRSIIEEKASKLVELLMVSVKPLAMILGKILAVMTYVFGLIIVLFACAGISWVINGAVFDTTAVNKTINSLGLTSSVMNISPATIIIVFVSLLLGYLTMSIIAGISGTCCSSMEDVQTAYSIVVLLIMAAYIISTIVTVTDSTAVSIAVSLIPIISIFCAPVQYICGNISIWLLLISWVIQAVFIVLIAVFCSKIYADLIIHKGNRVKLKELISMAKRNKAREAQL